MIFSLYKMKRIRQTQQLFIYTLSSIFQLNQKKEKIIEIHLQIRNSAYTLQMTCLNKKFNSYL